MKKFVIFTDGASRGNPGLASAGFIIQSEDGVIWVQEGVFLGTQTNNYAEYSAVKLAFERLIKDFSKDLPTQILVKADSLLVVSQLSGSYKIKSPTLKVLKDQIHLLEKEVGTVTYLHVPRAENFLADRMANQALDNNI